MDFNLATLAMGAQAFGSAQQVGASYYAAQEQRNALRASADFDEINARLADRNAEGVFRSADRQAMAMKLAAGRAKARNLTAMASNGIDAGFGTGAAVTTSNDLMSEIDLNQLHANAVADAFGYKTQAVNLRSSANSKRLGAGAISPGLAATSTLIGTGQQVAGSWYQLNKVGAFQEKK